jgi:predicted phosphodiesterase
MRLGYTCAPTRTSVGGAKMRIAVLSDIHGNLPALEAIFADVARRGVDHVVNLGDHVSGPLMPAETAQFLMRQPWTQINGNHDRELATSDPTDLIPSDAFARAQLGGEGLEWLAGLPPSSTVNNGGLLLHGTIRRDTECLLETIENGAARLATPAEIEVRLGEAQAEVVLCGHSHIPRSVRTLSGQLIVNPGSVGLQAYEHNDPEYHIMQTGSPDARYAVIEKRAGQWSARLITVPYDTRPVVELARRNGRPEWASGLATGYFSPADSKLRPTRTT